MHSCLLEVNKDNYTFDTHIDDIAKVIVVSAMPICGVAYIEPVIKGDVNSDGKITDDGTRKALRASARIENLNAKEKSAADINGAEK